MVDALAKGHNGVSPNDCLETGPSLIPDLLGILIRFRRWMVALTADVTKAFLQVQVCREDQDVHRFLWDDQGIVPVMQFVRVPFGNKGSLFLLNVTVKHHLSKFPASRVVEELSEVVMRMLKDALCSRKRRMSWAKLVCRWPNGAQTVTR